MAAVETFGPGGLLSQRTGGVSYFYTFDPTGHAALRRGGAGTASYAFDAFGQRAFSATSDPFTGFLGRWGGYTDAETGLTLLTRRFYDPAAGRFLTRDLLGYAGGLDLYAYSLNDPVNLADPSGLSSGGAGGGPSDGDPYDPDGNWDGLGMGSGHDGMHAGTPRNHDVNNMIGGLKDTLILAAAGPVLDGAAAAVEGAVDLAGAIGSVIRGGEGIPDDTVIVRGGTSDMPPPGEVYSGAQGSTLEDAGAGVPHGTIRSTSAGGIRGGGGNVVSKPEPGWDGGPINPKHVNITDGPGGSGWSDPFPNPVPKSGRFPGRPR